MVSITALQPIGPAQADCAGCSFLSRPGG